jgi:hypothetical protein
LESTLSCRLPLSMEMEATDLSPRNHLAMLGTVAGGWCGLSIVRGKGV